MKGARCGLGGIIIVVLDGSAVLLLCTGRWMLCWVVWLLPFSGWLLFLPALSYTKIIAQLLLWKLRNNPDQPVV
jgi:hypothetical protein